MPRTAVIADPRVKQHDTGPGHPEQAGRFTAVMTRLESTGVLGKSLCIEGREASDDELALVHRRDYIDLVGREVSQNRHQLSTGDTEISAHSKEAAKLAAGCAMAAVDAVFSKAATNAFCVVRPPGHHASAARGMGFCLFNNVALAARYAQKNYGAERIAIADWDVHHGNGTQDIFYEDSSVLFFSTHQSPWYPGTGAASERGQGKGEGTTINCPLPAGSGQPQIAGAFRDKFIPTADEFRPDLVLLSAGFDSRRGDPLGQFVLRDEDFRELTAMMTDLAARHCGERLISVLEGGYSLEGLACAAEAHVRELQGG